MYMYSMEAVWRYLRVLYCSWKCIGRISGCGYVVGSLDVRSTYGVYMYVCMHVSSMVL